MWPFRKKAVSKKIPTSIFFSNTLSGKKELFTSLRVGVVTLYSCGPTVYSKAHIGNLRSYVFSDTLTRVLESARYRVQRVINITDVGHLVSDGDEGDDKMEVSALREGVHADDIAQRYIHHFMEDISHLGIKTKEILFPRATQYIQEQIEFIAGLQRKGLTYKTSDGIYFDTKKYSGYKTLGLIDKNYTNEDPLSSDVHTGIPLEKNLRARVVTTREKRSPQDFAVWKFSPLGSARLQEWSSPWGKGFPGWHIECSAMIKALLGTEIDIHTGGIDHIPIHHTNEIAQSEALFEKPLARFWMHGAFLTTGNEKASKSLGNVVYLSEIIQKGYHPLSLRYFFLQAHYKTPLSFSWEALSASDTALKKLWHLCEKVSKESKKVSVSSETLLEFYAHVYDDLGTPKALALLWETLKDETASSKIQYGLLLVADEIFGLSLLNPPHIESLISKEDTPEHIQKLITLRANARAEKEYQKADDIRLEIERCGYRVEDGPLGLVLSKIQ
jgi:cysteinyl-tRNA synthetase